MLCTMLTVHSMAQSIRGTVITNDGNPAPSVSVQLKNKNRGTTTNDKGYFEFKKVTPGTYTVLVSLIGYKTTEKDVTVMDDSHTTVAVRLDASDAQLQEVVIAARQHRYEVSNVSPTLRLQTPILEVPQNIQVITGKLLQDQQVFDLLEGVTRNVSGAQKMEHWDNYARINMRGSQVTPFRNGMNVSMPWGPLAEDMSFVERIEFVKGPAGFMMASGDPAGFYNVVTKKPTGINKREASVVVGSFDTYRATLDLDGKITNNGKLLYRLNLMGQKKRSHRQFDYNDRYTIAPVLSYQFNDKTSITAEYTYQFSKMAVIGSAYIFSPNGYGDLPRDFTTAEKNLSPTSIHDQSIYLTFRHQFSKNWSLTAQGAYFNISQEGSSLWPDSLHKNGDMFRAVSQWDSRGRNGIGQVFMTGKVQSGGITHQLLGGVDFTKKKYMAIFPGSIAFGNPFNVYNPVHGLPDNEVPVFDYSKPLKDRANYFEDITNTNFYIQDELHFFHDIVRLTLAGRYTMLKQDNLKENRFTPRVGLSVSVDKHTSVYALFDQTFSPQPGIVYPDRPVRPMVGSNLEAGIKKDWFGGKWNSTLAVYRINRDHVTSTDDTHQPSNTYSFDFGQTRTEGVEVDIKGEIVKGLNLIFNYAFTDSKNVKAGDGTKAGTFSPGFIKHATNGWLSYRFSNRKLNGLGIAAGYQWLVDRTSWGWDAVGNKKLPDYFRLDGQVSWQNSKYSVAVNVNNLLNTYLYTGSPYANYYYYQTEPGTNFRVSVGYKF